MVKSGAPERTRFDKIRHCPGSVSHIISEQVNGEGPFPAVILSHGFPPTDGDLYDLGRNPAEEGFNALIFNYSGTWKSEGVWTPKTSLKSVESAIKFLQQEETIKTFGVDTTDFAFIGHS